jgi:hypothetical protein
MQNSVSAIKAQFDDLDKLVVERGGILTTDMRDLRERLQAGKLGRYVIENIRDQLKSRGLASSELTNEQTDPVRIYKQGTFVANLIEAATSVGEAHDEKLRLVAESKADEILKQIRALVCP